MPALRTASLAALLLASAVPAAAQSAFDADTLRALGERIAALERALGAGEAGGTAPVDIAALDQRIRVLERKLELQAEADTAKAATAPVVALSAAKGASIKSAAGDVELKLRGLVQADARVFVDDDDANPHNDTALLRRVRPTLEGTWGPLLGFRLTPEFAGDNASIVDAYLDLKFDPRATLRVGKMKAPVGLERLQSASAIALIERAFPTELAPNRDIGAQLQGEFGNGLSYAAGVFNGAADGRDAATVNPDNAFEFAGRVFFEPWKHAGSAWSGAGFGIAGSVGNKAGAGNAALPRYRTPGQAQVFNYRAAVLADGRHARVSPQGHVYRGPFGLLGEYIVSEQDVALASGIDATLEHRAWQLTGSWVLTGEDAGYRGVVRPDAPFTNDAAGWGAFELVARIGRLSIDDDAFPLFADPAVAVADARTWGVGLNWYLTSNLKLVANYTHTAFDGGAANAADREDEQLFSTRAQLSF